MTESTPTVPAYQPPVYASTSVKCHRCGNPVEKNHKCGAPGTLPESRKADGTPAASTNEVLKQFREVAKLAGVTGVNKLNVDQLKAAISQKANGEPATPAEKVDKREPVREKLTAAGIEYKGNQGYNSLVALAKENDITL